MTESILSGSIVLLYGRKVEDLAISPAATATPDGNLLLHAQYFKDDGAQNPAFTAVLARIYAFSFGGEYQELAHPTLFLVHGNGTNVTQSANAAKSPGDPDESGGAGQIHQFSKGLQFWRYEQTDLSVRLDVSSGMLKDILMADDDGDDGDNPTVGGGRVGGGRVGGGRVGGGRVGGGRVGGGRVGGGRVGGG